MKIIFDHKIFFQQKYGGPSRYFYNLFENINNDYNNSWKAHIVSPIYYNEFLKNSKFRNRVFGIKLPKIKYLGFFFKRINCIFSDLIINNINPNIIHTTDYNLILYKKKFPIILTVHDLIHEIYHDSYGQKDNYRPKKKILEISNHVICVSENTKKDLMKYYDIDEKKISVIYHGNSFENYKINKKIEPINHKFFLYIGSRKRYKNFFKVIEAFRKSEKIYNEYKLFCAGGEKFSEEEKKKLLELKIDLTKIIFFEKYDDDNLYNLYKCATALIYPSYYEGFGMPIVEAMSLGCPVISSNASSLPEVYGKAALNFIPSSSLDLKNKMEEIAYETKIKNKLIKLGFEQSKKFTWKKSVEETLSIYNKFI